METKALPKLNFKLRELRASLLEVSLDEKGKEKYSKCVAIELTDPALLLQIQALLEPALAKEQEAAGIAAEDQFTLENCEDGSKFHLSGKTLTDEEKKKFALNKKKKAA